MAENGDNERAVEQFKLSLAQRMTILGMHDQRIMDVQDSLAKSYAAIGNYRQSLEYLHKCLKPVEMK